MSAAPSNETVPPPARVPAAPPAPGPVPVSMNVAPGDRTAPPAPPTVSAAAPLAPVASAAGPVPPVGPPGRSPVGLLVLFVTGVLLVGWLSWLGHAALTKSHAPPVSRAQAAAATVPVRAKLTTGSKDLRATHERREAGNPGTTNTLRGEDDKPAFLATVTEQLTPNGPAPGAQIGVGNLPQCVGYTGDGEYLLLLDKDPDATIDGRPSYYLVGQQRSPGSDPGFGAPVIYPWTDATGDDLRQQVKRLFP